MTIEEILAVVDDWDGVLVWRPGPGDGSPEVAWGDAFVYHAPDGRVPTTGQPFATVVTKDYPGDEASRLGAGRFRVNVAAGREEFVRRVGRSPRDPASPAVDPAATDVVIAHPVYGELGWLAVVDPGPRTEADLAALLRQAYDLARGRAERRTGEGGTTGD